MEIPSVILSVIKKYYYRGIYRRNGADKFIFLLPTELTTEKKLPTKDSPTEYVSYTDGKIPSVKLLNHVVLSVTRMRPDFF
jgi:hypothetical protein